MKELFYEAKCHYKEHPKAFAARIIFIVIMLFSGLISWIILRLLEIFSFSIDTSNQIGFLIPLTDEERKNKAIKRSILVAVVYTALYYISICIYYLLDGQVPGKMIIIMLCMGIMAAAKTVNELFSAEIERARGINPLAFSKRAEISKPSAVIGAIVNILIGAIIMGLVGSRSVEIFGGEGLIEAALANTETSCVVLLAISALLVIDTRLLYRSYETRDFQGTPEETLTREKNEAINGSKWQKIMNMNDADKK